MHCHICKSQKTFVLDNLFEVYGCEECGHEWSALPPERQETYSPEYFREAHKRWFEHPNTVLFGKINTVVSVVAWRSSGTASFLDVGCGQGDLLRYMRDAGNTIKLFGIDLVENRDDAITYYKGDFVSFSFTERFDIISGLMVIEHIGDPHGFIKDRKSVV